MMLHWGTRRSLFLFFMQLLFWRLLPVHSQPAAAQALLAFKTAVGGPPSLNSWVGDPCRSKWRGVKCTGNKVNSAVTSLKLSSLQLHGLLSPALGNLTSLNFLWLDDNHLEGNIPSELGNIKNLISLRLSKNLFTGRIPSTLLSLSKLNELFLADNKLSGLLPFSETPSAHINIKATGNPDLCSRNGEYNLTSCTSSLAPALVFDPGEGLSKAQSHKSKTHVAAIAGGVVGAAVLVAMAIALVSLCLLRAKNWPSNTSDTGSSDPSAQVDWAKGPESPTALGGVPIIPEVQRGRFFSFGELDHATKGFSTSNLIGEGKFGMVYKGLLEDGTIVAIKKRNSMPCHEFLIQAEQLCQMRHRHLVSFLGCCQDNDRQIQMLIYDYLPNGNVCSLLYDKDGNPRGSLDFKQRLSIAVGAGKGLQYLHEETALVAHADFKSSNVLLDENFVAKVTDFGLSGLLQAGKNLGSSSDVGTIGYVDPEYHHTKRPSKRSDVYSFGVFLLELISGREAISEAYAPPEGNLIEWAHLMHAAGSLQMIVDSGIQSGYSEGMHRMLAVAFQCIDSNADKRPTINGVVNELEQILEKERGLATGGTAIVTLGSELFT